MTAAGGPPCSYCGKRVSKRAVPRCPWCGVVLCYKCICPNRCASSRFATPENEKEKKGMK